MHSTQHSALSTQHYVEAPPLPLLRRPARGGDAPAPPAAAGAEPPGEQAAQSDRSATGEAVEPAVADRRLHRAQRDLPDGRRARPQARPAVADARRPEQLDEHEAADAGRNGT